jgi:aryl-alcohol dehydrogenase-like predicted oxidoreductase
MEYCKLGNSGLKVSEIGLGGNNFGWWADEATSISVINHALDMGVTFIDTADMYKAGESEEFVGKAIKNKRSDVIIATKFGSPMGKGPNDKGGSRYYIMRAVEASLRRLQTDYIDLYYMHVPDPTTPIEETLRALDDLVRSGKVRYIGCCNTAGWQLGEALWTSRTNGLASFVVAQSRYNILERQIESELYPCCEAHNVGVIPWGPLSGGFLTGRYQRGEETPAGGFVKMRMYDYIKTEANWKKLDGLKEFAAQCGHTVGHLAIAWLLARERVCSVIAGARNIEQVSENVAAAEWKLTADELTRIEEICSA